MGLISRTTDVFYSFRFLRLLTMPWNTTGAFEAGIIDAEGKILRKPETADDRNVYNLFHKLIFNLKRLLNKLPFGKKTISSYLAALYLIKEETGMSDAKLSEILHELTGIYADTYELNESAWYINEDASLRSGQYTLLNNIALPKTGEVFALKNSRITIGENAKPVGSIFGTSVYEALHYSTKQKIYITSHDIIQ